MSHSLRIALSFGTIAQQYKKDYRGKWAIIVSGGIEVTFLWINNNVG